MRFIRERAGEGSAVADVLAHVRVSLSALQRRFRGLLGRSIHEVIAGVRQEGAKQLLIKTDLPLSAITERAGSSHVESCYAAFRQGTGSPPGSDAAHTRGCGDRESRAACPFAARVGPRARGRGVGESRAPPPDRAAVPCNRGRDPV
jgi:AraC-like DNA-binding protein